MITLYHGPITVSLASFDEIRKFGVGWVNLENKLLSTLILNRSHLDIF